MVFGYPKEKLNEFGLVSLREVTFQADSQSLKSLAKFLLGVADELESDTPRTSHWHRHCDAELATKFHCEVVVAVSDGKFVEPPRVVGD